MLLKTLKIKISNSVWSVQHLNASQNIQQTTYRKKKCHATKKKKQGRGCEREREREKMIKYCDLKVDFDLN